MEPRTRMLAVYCASGSLAIFCATDKICQFLVPHWKGERGSCWASDAEAHVDGLSLLNGEPTLVSD